MLVALGIILLIVGGVVAFAIDTAVDGVDLLALGYILMGGGALALLIGAVQGVSFMSMNNRKTRKETHVSPDGNHVVQESKTQNQL